MGYCHIEHAGNFADVFKHSVLTLLLRELRKQEPPFCYMETHAGAGRYDLCSDAAQTKGEHHRRDIVRLCETASAPEALSDYLAAVRAVNIGGERSGGSAVRYYPGSPRIARFMLRDQDRMTLFERHPGEASRLVAEFAGDPQVTVHQEDGYAGLKTLVPPKAPHGLVLIDPAYARADEADEMITGLQAAYNRWPSGLYAVWYPVRDRASCERFYRAWREGGMGRILRAEICPRPEDNPPHMSGCGMLLLNPPASLENTLRQVLPWLLNVLCRRVGTGHMAVDWW